MYNHGGDIFAYANMLGCDIYDIIDLSSNINYQKPYINTNLNEIDISYYPNDDKLCNDIAYHYGVDNKCVSMYNGISSAIYHLLYHIHTRQAYVYAPLYTEYIRYLSYYDYDIHYINRLSNTATSIQPNSLVIFVNPSTPDGKYYDISLLIDEWIDKQCTIIVDEAFIDFVYTRTISATKYLGYDKIYVLKSMTKIYSSAGIRVGTIISSIQNIKALNKNKPLWQISSLDSAYISQALQDKQHIQNTKYSTNKHYKILKEVLSNTNIFDTIYDSDTNYILAKLKKLTAQELQSHLNQYKILIRDCSNFDFLDNHHIRVAIKDINSINILRDALNVL